MPPLSGLIGRALYALLVGVITFIVFYIIGAVVAHFDANIGLMLERFSPLIGLLAGLVTFFTRATPPTV